MLTTRIDEALRAAAAGAALLFATLAGARGGCPGAGTVGSQVQITGYVGGFGEGLEPTDIFGDAVALLGDLDGDGNGDLAVGAQKDDDGGFNRGAVWILFLNGDGTVKSKQKISSTQGGFGDELPDENCFGVSVESLGDFDGDGVVDIAVGSLWDNDGGVRRGAVWIVLLHSDGTVKAKQKISSTAGGFGSGLDDFDFFGSSVASLGDLNLDGTIDIAVGALDDDDGGIDRGAVWILFLHADGTVKSKQKISSTSGAFGGGLDDGDLFGYSVESFPGFAGSSAKTLLVGSILDDDGGTNRGAIWALSLNPDGTVSSKQKISSTQGGFGTGLDDGDQFGNSMTPVGDLDGDDIVDLASGAIQDDDGGPDRGAVWVLFLSADGSVKAKQKISQTTGSFEGSLINCGGLGRSVSSFGETDADGRVLLAVGAYSGDGALNSGEVWLLRLDTCSVGPTITKQPTSALMDVGGGLLQFTVAAQGNAQLNYQWRRDGEPLVDGGAYLGATTPTLTVNATSWLQIGVYDCVVSTAFAPSVSHPAVLGIRQSCPGDIDGDSDIDAADLASMLGAWGLCPTP